MSPGSSQDVADALHALIETIAEFRQSHGRDALRNLPLGKTLDHLDMERCPGAELERVQTELGKYRRAEAERCFVDGADGVSDWWASGQVDPSRAACGHLPGSDTCPRCSPVGP